MLTSSLIRANDDIIAWDIDSPIIIKIIIPDNNANPFPAVLFQTQDNEGSLELSAKNAKYTENLKAKIGTKKPKETTVKYNNSIFQSGFGSLINNK